MRIKLLLILLVNIFNCNQGVDFTTRNGIGVIANGIDISRIELEQNVDYFIYAFQSTGIARGEQIARILNGSTLEIVRDQFACSAGTCSGIQDFKYIRIAYMNGPLCRTALTHELAHMVLQYILMDDLYHQNEFVWSVVGKIDYELCGDKNVQ